jgi:glycosyltransferase involved in cell wall biosynthesis
MEITITEKEDNSLEKASICLNMIVKNESHIIRGTLEMLCNKICFDYWVICDTGSTDGTQDIITQFFKEKGINGELFSDEWVDFAHNRSLALNRAFGKTDLLLVFDADDEIHGDLCLPVNKSDILYDEYHLKFGSQFGTSYTRVLLINNQKRFRYFSVLHEFISCLEPNSRSTVVEGDYFLVSGRSGNRSQDPKKYLNDALILEKAHAKALTCGDQLYKRYAFYCANSYKDYGNFEDAIKWYKITLKQDNWLQEKYVSCLYIYDCYTSLGQKEHGFFYLIEAFSYDIERVECLYPLLLHYACSNKDNIAYNYYLVVKDFYETRFLQTNMDKKLFIQLDKGNFFVPYYMILVADKAIPQDIECVLKMFEIIFTKKQKHIDVWYIKNLLYNLQFFVKHVKQTDMSHFLKLTNEYILFIKSNGVPLETFDFLKDYCKYGIDVDHIFQTFKKVTQRIGCAFEKEQCERSNNILFYVGFSDIHWNYSYLTKNAMGGSEKAVAYLTKALSQTFKTKGSSKKFKIYIVGDLINEELPQLNITYLHLSQLPKLITEIPFHSVVCSRYIAFLEMFNTCSFHQFYIWAHDTMLLPYGCNLSDNAILEKWSNYIDGCICQTEWHANEYKKRYPSLENKTIIINNGIDTAAFPSSYNSMSMKQCNKFIYTSRTERGLDRVLELWPQILLVMPDAELTISTYTKFPLNKQEERLKTIIDQYDSITHLGQLNTEQLYNEMKTAEYWLYPTSWPETSCITALEMLMSEVICLYYPVAGLTNTIDRYGIQIQRGNEIETLTRLTTEQKNELRLNGKEYALNCSWSKRSEIWNKLLQGKEHKKIAIFNSFVFHYEMFGYIIEYCKRNECLLTIFTSTEHTLGWLDFYPKFFKNYKFEFKNPYEFEEFKDSFDFIFVTTDDDYGFKTEWINDKCISINHINKIRRLEFKNNLATRPFIENYKNWAIPCYPILNISDKQTSVDLYTNIAIIGGLNDGVNYDILNRLESNVQIILHICNRNNNKLNIDNIKSSIIVKLYLDIDTTDLIDLLKKCDYVLTDFSMKMEHVNGLSMSGAIALAFSTLSPLIISKKNNNIYHFENVIEYEIGTQDNIIIEKGKINNDLLVKERQKLISMFNHYNDSLIFNNKNTALIIDPRNNDNLPYLINDFKKKLGNNWKIVFYCGKGLKNEMNLYIEDGIEIRELDVNNFTINEYSDFMKRKELWESLYGEFVITFQADTYILNVPPYTIDYFMNLNKSYIGGNMDHGWDELIRENIYPNYRNFNGGLSLRKRLDMIEIINTFGIEPTLNNSQKIQTDIEDVYFTLGCYKLNYPIGDTKECEHFSLNRIWVDKFFGIHKPIPAVFENLKEISEKYCKETNTFLLKPKIGFIMLRHVSNDLTNKYWIHCYKCIREHYPENIIIIIDDNSNYNFITDEKLYKTIIINSEYHKRGEVLPYYYYLHNKLFDIGVIIHDSVFINQYIDMWVDKYKLIWEFEHDWDQIEDETKMIDIFDNLELRKFYENKHSWNGCFGAMAIISHDYLTYINNKYDISKFLDCVVNRTNRSSFERVFACLLQANGKKETLLGNIHSYCPWGISFDEKDKYSYLPLTKVWTGR